MKTAVFLTAAIIAAVFLPAALPALHVHIAPILYVDETAGNTRETDRVQRDLLSALRKEETGITLQFDSLSGSRINPPQSLPDAITVCRDERIEYLLYGYVTIRQHTIHAEIRLFEYETRRVMQSFFGMDSTAHYNRLLEDIAWKILSYISETFHPEIKKDKTEMTRLLIPAMLGYWTPLDSSWAEVMLGTFSLGSGFVFIPTDNLFMFRGMSCYLSSGMEIKYRLGAGNPSGYQAFNHTLFITVPLRLHVPLTQEHQVFLGLGYTYFLEFFAIADKYSNTEIHVFNNMGMQISIGYRYVFNQKLTFFFRNDIDFLFNRHSLITYSPVIGIDIQVYEKEMKRRW
jgi:hypothetical protein